MGRWLSRDPIGEKGGIALYIYVKNRTPRYIDSTGTKISDVVEILGGLDDKTFEQNFKHDFKHDFMTVNDAAGLALISCEFEIPGCVPCDKNSISTCYKISAPEITVRLWGKVFWRAGQEKYEKHELSHKAHDVAAAKKYDSLIEGWRNKCITFKCCEAKRKYSEVFQNYVIAEAKLQDARIDFEDYPFKYIEETSKRYGKAYHDFWITEDAEKIAAVNMRTACGSQ